MRHQEYILSCLRVQMLLPHVLVLFLFGSKGVLTVKTLKLSTKPFGTSVALLGTKTLSKLEALQLNGSPQLF